MRRRLLWALGAGFVVVGLAQPASAQVHVAVGIGTPRVGAHVVIGQPRPYVVERVYEPVYYEPVYVERVHVVHDHRCKHKHAHGWNKHEREYYKDARHARRDYEKAKRVPPKSVSRASSSRPRSAWRPSVPTAA